MNSQSSLPYKVRCNCQHITLLTLTDAIIALQGSSWSAVSDPFLASVGTQNPMTPITSVIFQVPLPLVTPVEQPSSLSPRHHKPLMALTESHNPYSSPPVAGDCYSPGSSRLNSRTLELLWENGVLGSAYVLPPCEVVAPDFGWRLEVGCVEVKECKSSH